jgi:hypothetical protein
MISNHSPQSIFYTLTISAITALLLTSCGGSSSSSSTATAKISGTLTESDGTTPIDEVTVELDDLKAAKTLSSLTTKTDVGGKYTVQNSNTGDFQLIFTKDGFLKQYKNITVSSSGVSAPPTFMSAAAPSQEINEDGGEVTASGAIGGEAVKVQIPTNAAGQNISVSLTLLKGAEIPAVLPTEEGKTLLPVGALAMGITPSSVTSIKASKVSVPVPSVLQDDRKFTVYILKNGKWDQYQENLTKTGTNTVDFDITIPSTYMVMTEIDDITNVGATINITNGLVETVEPGATIDKPVTNSITINFDQFAGTADEKAEVKALIESLLEQQNGTKFDVEQTNSLEISSITTKQISAKLAAKTICTITNIITEKVYVFVFPNYSFTVTVTIRNWKIDCQEQTGATGGTS